MYSLQEPALWPKKGHMPHNSRSRARMGLSIDINARMHADSSPSSYLLMGSNDVETSETNDS